MARDEATQVARQSARAARGAGWGAARVSVNGDRSGAQGDGAPAAGRRTSKVTVSRIDPWSAARTAFIVSLAISLSLTVVVTIVWFFLSVTGVIDAIQGSFGNILGTGVQGGVSLFGFVRVLGLGLIVSAIQILTTSAAAALFAMMYNLTVSFTGGIKVSLESTRD